MLKKVLLTIAAGSMGILALGGCADPETPTGEGNLAPMSAEPQSGATVIGAVIVNDPVAIFDEPGGVTIGRLEPGEYAFQGTEGDWVRVGFVGTSGWVVSSEVQLKIN